MLTNLELERFVFNSEGAVSSIADDVNVEIDIIRDLETNQKEGIYIEWSFILDEADIETFVRCDARSTHDIDFKTLTAQKLSFLIECSFNDFQNMLNEKAKEHNSHFTLSFLLTEGKKDEILTQLCL